MNWYKFAQFEPIEPQNTFNSYLSIGHGDRKNNSYLWWSNNGSDVDALSTNVQEDSFLPTHPSNTNWDDANGWKGRYDGLTKYLSIMTPWNLRVYRGVPNRLLYNLKKQFDIQKIKLYIRNGQTYIKEHLNV